MSKDTNLTEFVEDTRETVVQAERDESFGPGNERWELRPLSELIEPVLGKTPKRSEDDYWGGDIQWASAKDISQCETRHLYDTAENMTEAGQDASNAKTLPAGTVVVIARGATMGRVAQLGRPMTFNQTCYGLVTTDELLDDYLYYAWQYVFGQVQAVSYGTVFDSITMKSFKNIEIPVPPLEQQEEIAERLSTLDDLRESSTLQREVLEKTTQEIYSGWFESYTRYEDFRESEVGKIPEEFEVKQIGDVLSLEYGEGLPEKEREQGSVPVYGSNGVTGHHNLGLIEGPGIIVGRKGTIGTARLELNDFWPIDTTFYVEPETGFEIFYLYHLLKATPLAHLGSDSAVPGLNRNVAEDQVVAVPPQSERDEFVKMVNPFHQQKKLLKECGDTINKLRDTLLPKLLSGEIRLPA